MEEREFMVRTEEEIYQALRRFCDIAWSGASVFSIPVNQREDADCILYDAVKELLQRRAGTFILPENEISQPDKEKAK